MALRISEKDFQGKVLEAQLPTLVDFYSDSCVACKKLAPVLGDLEDENEDKISVYKVNVNFDLALAEKYQVTSNPTLILFVNGEEVDRRTGALSSSQLEEFVKDYL